MALSPFYASMTARFLKSLTPSFLAFACFLMYQVSPLWGVDPINVSEEEAGFFSSLKGHLEKLSQEETSNGWLQMLLSYPAPSEEGTEIPSSFLSKISHLSRELFTDDVPPLEEVLHTLRVLLTKKPLTISQQSLETWSQDNSPLIQKAINRLARDLYGTYFLGQELLHITAYPGVAEDFLTLISVFKPQLPTTSLDDTLSRENLKHLLYGYAQSHYSLSSQMDKTLNTLLTHYNLSRPPSWETLLEWGFEATIRDLHHTFRDSPVLGVLKAGIFYPLFLGTTVPPGAFLLLSSKLYHLWNDVEPLPFFLF